MHVTVAQMMSAKAPSEMAIYLAIESQISSIFHINFQLCQWGHTDTIHKFIVYANVQILCKRRIVLFLSFNWKNLSKHFHEFSFHVNIHKLLR